MLRRKTKRVILVIAAVLILLVGFLIAVIFTIHDDELSFRFLDPYEVGQRRSFTARDHTGENIMYHHIRVDYDTFVETAEAELLAKGFTDISDPNRPYNKTYRKDAFEDIEVEIQFGIVRSGPALNEPLFGPLVVQIRRIKPKFNIHNSWFFLRTEYSKIRYKIKYHHP